MGSNIPANSLLYDGLQAARKIFNPEMNEMFCGWDCRFKLIHFHKFSRVLSSREEHAKPVLNVYVSFKRVLCWFVGTFHWEKARRTNSLIAQEDTFSSFIPHP